MQRKERKVKPKVVNGHQLAAPLPSGQILTDLYKKQWILGKSIGVGGFGQIYSASNDVSKSVGANAGFVVKVEPHANGPLFAEIHVYHRLAKSEMIEEWKENAKLKFLGMPKFIGSGSHEYNGTKYRFMVMDRFGDDLQKLFLENGKIFPFKTVLNLGLKIIDVLEYIHHHGYVHCDVKASNLLLGVKSSNDVYLVDFGLACRYLKDNVHKPFVPDPKKAHDGTIEYTSRDAHVGLFSRRGDLEILAYNMLEWSSGKLPWEKDLKDCEKVKSMKNKYLENLPKLFDECFKKSNVCSGLKQFFEYILTLDFDEKPNYSLCRKLFKDALKTLKFKDDGKLEFKHESPKRRIVPNRSRSSKEVENIATPSPPAMKMRSSSRKPCAPAQSNRLKRSSPTDKQEKSLLDNPTPAMLLIMENKRKKEEKKNLKRISPQSTGSGKRMKRNMDISPDLF